jgi:hypothetical protein
VSMGECTAAAGASVRYELLPPGYF